MLRSARGRVCLGSGRKEKPSRSKRRGCIEGNRIGKHSSVVISLYTTGTQDWFHGHWSSTRRLVMPIASPGVYSGIYLEGHQAFFSNMKCTFSFAEAEASCSFRSNTPRPPWLLRNQDAWAAYTAGDFGESQVRRIANDLRLVRGGSL